MGKRATKLENEDEMIADRLQCTIEALRPNAVFGINFNIGDSNTGNAFIQAWDESSAGAKPTPVELANAEAAANMAACQAQKLVQLTAACSATIRSGFASKATGSVLFYPSTMEDQANVTRDAAAANTRSLLGLSSVSALVMCKAVGAADSAYALVKHSGAQVQQVNMDMQAWINAQRVQLKVIAAQVPKCNSETQVSNVTWTPATVG